MHRLHARMVAVEQRAVARELGAHGEIVLAQRNQLGGEPLVHAPANLLRNTKYTAPSTHSAAHR